MAGTQYYSVHLIRMLVVGVLVFGVFPLYGQPAEVRADHRAQDTSTFIPFKLKVLATNIAGTILPATAALSYKDSLVPFYSQSNRLFIVIHSPEPVEIIFACQGYDTLTVKFDPARKQPPAYTQTKLVHPDRPLWVSTSNQGKDAGFEVRLKKSSEGWTFLSDGLSPCQLGTYLVFYSYAPTSNKSRVDKILSSLSLKRVALICGGWYVKYEGQERMTSDLSDVLLKKLRRALEPLNMKAASIVYLKREYKPGWRELGYKEPLGDEWLSNWTVPMCRGNDHLYLNTTANTQRLREIIESVGLDWSKRGGHYPNRYWRVFGFSLASDVQAHSVVHRLLAYPEITDVRFSLLGSSSCE